MNAGSCFLARLTQSSTSASHEISAAQLLTSNTEPANTSGTWQLVTPSIFSELVAEPLASCSKLLETRV